MKKSWLQEQDTLYKVGEAERGSLNKVQLNGEAEQRHISSGCQLVAAKNQEMTNI